MRRAPVEWLVELLAAAATLFPAALVALRAPDLPARFPVHFGLSGQPDRWATPDSAWLLPGVALFCYGLLTLGGVRPEFLNVPMRLDRSNPAVRKELARMALVMKVTMGFVFAVLTWASLEVAFGHQASLGPAAGAALLLPLAAIAVSTLRLRRL